MTRSSTNRRTEGVRSAPTKSILHLNLHKEFFEAIAEGRKKVEYRENKPYWRRRLEGRTYDEIEFRNGFAPGVPRMRVELLRIRREGRKAFAIDLGRLLEIENWPARRR